jgi:hypothetical protein
METEREKESNGSCFHVNTLISAVALFQFVILVKATAVQVQTVQSLEPKPQFEFDVVRAYLQGNSCSLDYNITYVSDLPSSNKTIIEVYSIELFSNGNLLGSKGQGFFVSGNIELGNLMGLTSYIPYASSGISSVNWNESKLRPDSFQLLHALNPLEDYSGTISLRVKRLGLITVEGESVDNGLSSGELIQQVELEKYGEGFLYSALPVSSPTPSPSPELTPKVEPFPTTLVVASVVLVAVIGIGLIVYFKKRKRGATRS